MGRSAMTTFDNCTMMERYRPERDYSLFIDGDWMRPQGGRFDAIDPSTGQPWAVLGQASREQVDLAVASSRRAFLGWRRSSLSTRQRILWEMADRIEAD